MELEWTDARTRQFVTNVGLITSHGPLGSNIMAAEWTHHISYAPSLLAICIDASDATMINIEASREFGVSLAAESQRVFCSVAGGSTGRTVDKLAVLTELGATFYPGSRIAAPMLARAAMNAECKVREIVPFGDHHMVVGEVVELSGDPAIRPLVYHQGRYWVLGDPLSKPAEEEISRINSIIASRRKA